MVTLCYFRHTIYCNIHQHLAKWFVLYSVNHKNKKPKPYQAKTNHKTTLIHSTYMYFKHWKALETTLTTESTYIPGKLALPIHPASSSLINYMLVF